MFRTRSKAIVPQIPTSSVQLAVRLEIRDLSQLSAALLDQRAIASLGGIVSAFGHERTPAKYNDNGQEESR